MELQEKVAQFKAIQKKITAYNHAMGLLYYDSVTTAPKKSAEALGDTLGILSEESYKLNVNEELKALLNDLVAAADELDPQTRREAQRMLEDQEKMARIPMEEFVAYQLIQNEAGYVWHEAKATNNFAMFAPVLEKVIAYQKKLARWYQPEAENLYDVLLNEYEKGLNTEILDAYFAKIKAAVVPLLHRVATEGKAPRKDFVNRNWPVAKQREFSDYLMELLTIDKGYCAIGETEHPFTTGFSKHDVRITTHYHEDDLLSSLFSVVHEGGHALYELNMGDELIGSSLNGGTSMGVHESQSRFFENMIGRSREFCDVIHAKLTELFPEQMADVTAEELYRAANHAEASLIRTEADELTYSLHIMVRYEIEKKIFADELTVEQLPAEWNRLYKEYLGVDVPDDTRGVLQDTHWSGGMFGYFPSYSIGSAYAAQMYASMKKDLDVNALVAAGDLKPIVQWLADRVHKYGCMIDPPQIIEGCCGAAFDAQYYVDYLTEKFTKLYDLQ